MRGVPKWFFETARVRRIRSAISTSVRTLAPWHFWKRVPLHAPMSWGRLAVLVFGAMVISYVLVILATSAQPLAEQIPFHQAYSRQNRANIWEVTPLSTYPTILSDTLAKTLRWPMSGILGRVSPHIGTVISWIVLTTILMPVCFLALPKTFRVQRVRRAHLLRMAAYGMVATFVCMTLWIAIVMGWDWCSGRWGGHSFWISVSPGIDRIGLGKSLLCSPVPMFLWWWCACARYLRLSHAFWVAFLLQLMATLASSVVMSLFISDWTRGWLMGL